MKKIIKVEGTHCSSCKELIEEVCLEIKGVKSCKLDLKTGNLQIEYENESNLKEIKKEIEALGQYKVKL